MQDRRHKADYHPTVTYSKSTVVEWIDQAELEIKALNQASLKDRRAFAVFVLMDRRR